MSHSGMTPGEAAAYKEWLGAQTPSPTSDDVVLALALKRLERRGITPPCPVRIAEVPGGIAHIVKGGIEIDPKALRYPDNLLDAALHHEINWARDWPSFWN